jgi:hypothetical protein
MRIRTVAATVAVCALGMGAAACGGSDDDDNSGDATANETSQRLPGDITKDADPSTPEGQIGEVYVTHIGATYKKDAKRVCSTMTREAQATLARGAGSCAKWFNTTIAEGKLSPNRPYIVKLDIEGSRARGLVKTKNSERYPVVFEKEDGAWKLTAK